MAKYQGDIAGDLTVRAGDDVSALTSVGGWLDISAEGIQLPALTSVGGWLYISAEGIQLPALTSVGGGLDISAEGIQLPALTSVGCWLYIRAEGIQLPALTSVRSHDLPDAATAKARMIEVAKHALQPGALDMGNWHNESRGCGTVHCIAGWAIHLEGEAGYALESEVGPEAAGAILLGADAASLFHIDNDKARSVLHRVLREAGETPVVA